MKRRFFIVFFFFLPFLSLCALPVVRVSAQSVCFDADIPASSSWIGSVDGGIADFTNYTFTQVSGTADTLEWSYWNGTDWVLAAVLVYSPLYLDFFYTDITITNISGVDAVVHYCAPDVLVTPTPVLTPTPAPIDVLVERSNQSFQLNIFLGAGVVGLLALMIVRGR